MCVLSINRQQAGHRQSVKENQATKFNNQTLRLEYVCIVISSINSEFSIDSEDGRLGLLEHIRQYLIFKKFIYDTKLVHLIQCTSLISVTSDSPVSTKTRAMPSLFV